MGPPIISLPIHPKQSLSPSSKPTRRLWCEYFKVSHSEFRDFFGACDRIWEINVFIMSVKQESAIYQRPFSWFVKGNDDIFAPQIYVCSLIFSVLILDRFAKFHIGFNKRMINASVENFCTQNLSIKKPSIPALPYCFVTAIPLHIILPLHKGCKEHRRSRIVKESEPSMCLT